MREKKKRQEGEGRDEAQPGTGRHDLTWLETKRLDGGLSRFGKCTSPRRNKGPGEIRGQEVFDRMPSGTVQTLRR